MKNQTLLLAILTILYPGYLAAHSSSVASAQTNRDSILFIEILNQELGNPNAKFTLLLSSNIKSDDINIDFKNNDSKISIPGTLALAEIDIKHIIEKNDENRYSFIDYGNINFEFHQEDDDKNGKINTSIHIYDDNNFPINLHNFTMNPRQDKRLQIIFNFSLRYDPGYIEIIVPPNQIDYICKMLEVIFVGQCIRLDPIQPVFRVGGTTGKGATQLQGRGDTANKTPSIPSPRAGHKEIADDKTGVKPPTSTIIAPTFTNQQITTPDMISPNSSILSNKILLLYDRTQESELQTAQEFNTYARGLRSDTQTVRLNVWICEMRQGAVSDLGLRLGSVVGSGNAQQVIDGLATVFQEGAVPGGSATGFEAFSLGSFSRVSGFDFSAVLHTLERENAARILANPTLTTSNGVTASYFALERIPYLAEFTINQNAPPVGGVGYFDVGLSLFFEPVIEQSGGEDIVNLKILPVISSLVELLEVAPGVRAPRITQRQLHGEIRIPDGAIVCLSSLISEEERTTVHKVPLLGDIPALGKLFREKQKTKERKEIFIFVQPQIVPFDKLGDEVCHECVVDAVASLR